MSFAQIATTTATLSGMVEDQTGAVIPKATVTLSSSEKGINRSYTTDAAGRYSFNQLPPSTYTLTVKGKGFESYQQAGIRLNAGTSASQDVHLTVGAESESVTVTADASQLNADNSNIATEIGSKEIVELPLNMRNIFALATLNSSVQNSSESQQLLGGGGLSTDNADQDISFLNFGGGFFGTSAFLLDGSWDTDPQWGGVIYTPSPDAVQEFKVQNNSFTAQYGWSTGNVINVVTKAGTSKFHGSAYEFYRNADLDANLWFSNHNHMPKNSLSRNQTGVSAGGPLYLPGLYRQRDKTFIFGLFERNLVTTPTADTYTVPDDKFRDGDFSEILGAPIGKTDALGRTILAGQIYDPRSSRAITAGEVDSRTGLVANKTGYIRDPIPGNILQNLPGYVPDKIGAKLLSYYPEPTKAGLSNNKFASGSAPAESKEYLIRVDHNINDHSNAYFRYSYKQEYKTGEANDWGDNVAGPGNTRPNSRWSMAAGISEIFSPTFTMNVMTGVQIWHESSINQSAGFKPSTIGLPAYLDTNSPVFPVVNVGSQSNLGPIQGQYTVNHGPVGTVSVDLIKLAQKHTISFGFSGVELQDDDKNTYGTNLSFGGSFTSGPDPQNGNGAASGNGVAQMLLGVLDGGSAGTPYNPAVASHYLGGYIQDDWKPTKHFTLNMGIRYEVQTPVTYRHNVGSIFNPDVMNPISYAVGQPYKGALQFLTDRNRYSYDPVYTNAAPRMGFSEQFRPNAVLHGGYGIFYPPSMTCCFEADSDGFSATTSVQSTLPSLAAGTLPNPAVTTSNPWPQGYVQITGSSLGEYQQLGFNASSNFRHRPSPYVQQWTLGLQYAFTPNDQLDVNYVGNRGIRMTAAYMNRDQLDPKYLSLGTSYLYSQVQNPFYGHILNASCGGNSVNQPTVNASQLLKPYPQYCYVQENDANVGFSDYNALQVAFNHRISKGLTAMVSYTYSKFLDNVEGNQSWAYAGNAGPANFYNMAAEKSVDGGDIPQSLVVNYTYKIPVGRGKLFGGAMGKALDAVIGGWELTQVATFKGGIPLHISGSDIDSFGGNPRPDRVPGVSLHVPHPNINEWFNTAAFKFAEYGTFGNTPRYFSDLRGPKYQNWDTNITKNWKLPHEMSVQFRGEMYNTFNHPNFYSPSNTGYSGCDPNADASCSNSSYGAITQAFPSRTIQLAGKFYW